MEIWKIESNPVKQFTLSGVFAVMGIVFLIIFRDFDASGFTDSLSGFLLGVLLVTIAVASLFSIYRQTIIVDPTTKTITITSERFSGTEKQVIPFHTITNVCVAFLGRASNFIGNTHYLSLTLIDNSHCPLFFPAFFDGRTSKTVAEERYRRLMMYLSA